jgi:protein SCO1/2
LWGLLVVALVAVTAAAVVQRMRWTEPPPVLGEVPDFQLVDRDGHRVTRHDLAGHRWVADFVFTRCRSSCPLISERMAHLDRELPAQRDLRLVSFSVDPANDTPAVLARYAATLAASPRWLFLTGPPEAVYDLIRRGFKLGVDPTPAPVPPGAAAEPITHSTRFVLVDERGRIRGYYDAFDGEAMRKLKSDLATLAR